MGQFATTRRVLAARNGILFGQKSFMLHEMQNLSNWNLDLKTILYFRTTIACGAKGRLGERPFEPRAFLLQCPKFRRREKSILGQFAT